MKTSRDILGDDDMNFLFGTRSDDRVHARGGDDIVMARDGDDRVFGGAGFESLFGNDGADRLFGGMMNDNLYGGRGADVLHGDDGRMTLKGADLGADNLMGGAGNDTLYQSDGNDTLTGGGGKDTFLFKWQDPMVGLALGTGRAFATITDFNPEKDKFVFDVAGLGKDSAGANFLDGGDGTVRGAASSFFKGDAAETDGEAVMILDATGFATGADAVLAAQNEAVGDFVMYFNTTANVASLLYVDAPDTAHSIARFANIESIEDLAAAEFTANDFLFA